MTTRTYNFFTLALIASTEALTLLKSGKAWIVEVDATRAMLIEACTVVSITDTMQSDDVVYCKTSVKRLNRGDGSYFYSIAFKQTATPFASCRRGG